MDVFEVRIVSWKYSGGYRAMCLENCIAIEADNEAELRQKIEDAMYCFFYDMTEEELTARKYYRRAEWKYFFLWYVTKFWKKVKGIRVSVDLQTHELRFA